MQHKHFKCEKEYISQSNAIILKIIVIKYPTFSDA